MSSKNNKTNKKTQSKKPTLSPIKTLYKLVEKTESIQEQIRENYSKLNISKRLEFLLDILEHNNIEINLDIDAPVSFGENTDFISSCLGDAMYEVVDSEQEHIDKYFEELQVKEDGSVNIFDLLNSCIDEYIFNTYGINDYELSKQMKESLTRKMLEDKIPLDEKEKEFVLKEHKKQSFKELTELFTKYYPHLDVHEWLKENVMDPFETRVSLEIQELEQQNKIKTEDDLDGFLASCFNPLEIKRKTIVKYLFNSETENRRKALLKNMLERELSNVVFYISEQDEEIQQDIKELILNERKNGKGEKVFEDKNLNETLQEKNVVKGNKTIH